MHRQHLSTALAALALLLSLGSLTLQRAFGSPSAPLAPAGSAFLYQGRLSDGNQPANGAYAMDFRLFDAPSGGGQIGATLSRTVQVTDGLFMATLDFGSGVFSGEARYLEITINGSSGATTLTPRQPLSPVPYAVTALNALNIPLAGSGSAATAARSDHHHNGIYQSALRRTIVVSPVAGDPLASGAALLAAVAGISDSGQNNPYLIKIEPGVYQLGTATLELKPFVDLEGSGEGVTTIIGSSAAWDGVLKLAANTEARLLTVVNSGGGALASAIRVPVDTARLTQVTARAENASSTFAVHVSGSVSGASGAPVLLRRVTAQASGGTHNYGVYVSLSAARFEQVSASASGGAGSDNYGLYNDNNAGVTLVDSSFSAAGGNESKGIYSSASNLTMLRSSASAGGSSGVNAAVYNSNVNTGQQWARTANIEHSTLRGGTHAILNTGSGEYYVRVQLSTMGGRSEDFSAGAIWCVGVTGWDGGVQSFKAAGCPMP